MNRQVNLRENDIKELETALTGSGAYAGVPAEQKQFIDHILKRAKADKAGVTRATGWLWTWTYNF